jgi:hypothetical protein
MRQMRLQKQKKRKGQEQNNEDLQIATKRRCLNIDLNHSYLFSSKGMVSFTADYIQHLKETYNDRSYLGLPKYNCKYCNAIFWLSERNKSNNKKIKNLYSNLLQKWR